MWVKNKYSKCNPGKWKHGIKPAVAWWYNANPYTYTYILYLVRQTDPSPGKQLIVRRKTQKPKSSNCQHAGHSRHGNGTLYVGCLNSLSSG